MSMSVNIKLAEKNDASLIHGLMIKAFMEYKDEAPPSSALDETIQSISTALEDGEQALISFVDNRPIGMVRFRLKANGVYFYRLSVIPEKQGQGIAKEMFKVIRRLCKSKRKTYDTMQSSYDCI